MDEQYSATYVSDIRGYATGSRVSVTGQLLWRRKHRDRIVIELRDITGSIYVRISPEQFHLVEGVTKYSRIRVKGRVGLGRTPDQLVIREVEQLDNLGSLKVPYKDLGPEMREYASRLFVSRITNSLCSWFRENGFDEFESKVISTEWVDSGLEPLQALYPGFGAPVTLITSPNAQAMDFLNATGTKRAFTVSLSFTSTFRHANNSAETRVIVGKAVDMRIDELRKLSVELCRRAIERLGIDQSEESIHENVDAIWPDRPIYPPLGSDITVNQFNGDVRTNGAGWRNMLLENVIHITTHSGMILLDGSVEKIGERTVSTMVAYPSRFLSLIDIPLPRRQLSDLNEYASWHT